MQSVHVLITLLYIVLRRLVQLPLLRSNSLQQHCVGFHILLR